MVSTPDEEPFERFHDEVAFPGTIVFFQDPAGAVDFNAQKNKILGELADLEDRFRAAKYFPEIKKLFLDALEKRYGILRVKDDIREAVRREAASWRRLEAILSELEGHFLKAGDVRDVTIPDITAE